MRPKVLFIAHRIPYPPNKGDKIRSFHELAFLSKRYEVHLVTFVDDPRDQKHVESLRRYAGDIRVFRLFPSLALLRGLVYLLVGKSLSEGYYAVPRVKKTVRKLCKEHDYQFVFCFSSQIGQYAFDVPLVRVMDFCDVDSDKFAQYAKHRPFPLSWVYRLESRRLSAFASLINHVFDASILINHPELAVFNRKRRHEKLYVMPNGIDTDYFKPMDTTKERAVVFTGDMGYYANVDAMVWFFDTVWPLVLGRDPTVRFYVVGRNPAREVRAVGERFKDSVVVTGGVEDIRPFVARARMAVIPIRIARGIQNKILEAMAMGVPVMMHRTLFQSLGDLDEKDVLVFDTPREGADMILDSIDNEELLCRMSRGQRDYVLAHHNWDSHFGQSEVWRKLIERELRGPETRNAGRPAT